MERLNANDFLQELANRREAFWNNFTTAAKSYAAEKPLTPAMILRRLQFGVVMERRAAEVSARWVGDIPDVDLQRSLSEYVANELKHASIFAQKDP